MHEDSENDLFLKEPEGQRGRQRWFVAGGNVAQAEEMSEGTEVAPSDALNTDSALVAAGSEGP